MGSILAFLNLLNQKILILKAQFGVKKYYPSLHPLNYQGLSKIAIGSLGSFLLKYIAKGILKVVKNKTYKFR